MRWRILVSAVLTLWFGSYYLFDLVAPSQPAWFFFLVPIPWNLDLVRGAAVACVVSLKPADCLPLITEAWSVPGIPARVAILVIGCLVSAFATMLCARPS